jgi:hypothetical protein
MIIFTSLFVVAGGGWLLTTYQSHTTLLKVQGRVLIPQEQCSYFFASVGRLEFAAAHR